MKPSEFRRARPDLDFYDLTDHSAISVAYMAAARPRDYEPKEISTDFDILQGRRRFQVGPDRYLMLEKYDIQEIGLDKLLRAHGIRLSTRRLPVEHHGRVVGTLPANTDALALQSRSFLYSPRPGDIRRDGDKWIADKHLGPGDIEAIQGFIAQ